MYNQDYMDELNKVAPQLIKNMFEKLAELKGSAKTDYLRAFTVDLEDFHGAVMYRLALRYQFDPLITFGFSDAKFQNMFQRKIRDLAKTDRMVKFGKQLTFLELCEMLQNAPSVDDELMGITLAFLQTCDGYSDNYDELTDVAAFVRDFLCKKCRIGMTATTINKALGKEMFSTFGCMLANKYFEHQNFVEGKEFYVTEKLDGIRCLCIYGEDDKISFYTRQGQVIEGLDEVKQEIELSSARGLVLDGELLPTDMTGKTSAEGYKEVSRIVRSSGTKQGVTYHVFDCLPIREFVENASSRPYSFRRGMLDSAFAIRCLHPHVEVVPVLYHGTDTSKIVELMNEMRAKDREGVMVNIADAPYVCKRTNNLLKVKAMQDCDLRITFYEEGDGKYKDMLGAFMVEYKGNEVRVGSGYADQQRKDFWVDRDKLRGRVIKVQYFEETCDANGIPSLRFPVFKELREVGKEVSYE